MKTKSYSDILRVSVLKDIEKGLKNDVFRKLRMTE